LTGSRRFLSKRHTPAKAPEHAHDLRITKPWIEEIPHGGPNSLSREREEQLREVVLRVMESSNHQAKMLRNSKLLPFQKLIVVGVSGEQRKVLAGEQLCQCASSIFWQINRGFRGGFEQKVTKAFFSVQSLCSLCSLWLMNFEQKDTTESQRTQRLHREIPEQGLFVQSLPRD